MHPDDLFRNAAVALAILDDRGRCLAANDAICGALQTLPHKIRRRAFVGYIADNDRGAAVSRFKAMRTGDDTHFEVMTRINRADGQTTWMRLTGGPLPARKLSRSQTTEKPRPRYLIALQNTDRPDQNDPQTLAHERHFRATLNRAAVGVLLVSRSGQFLTVNTYFAEMLGYQRHELEGRNFRDFSAAEDMKANAPHRDALWRGEVTRLVGEKRWVHRDGHYIWARMTISIARELNVVEPYSIAIVEDITAAKEMALSQRLLVGELNHRVKNTLAMVQGMVKRTLVSTPDPAEFGAVLESRLLAISRAHDLLSQNDWRTLDLHDLAKTALLKTFSAHAQAFEIFCPSIPLTPHQATNVALVLHELATNAIKHGALSIPTGLVKLDVTLDQRRDASLSHDDAGSDQDADNAPAHTGHPADAAPLTIAMRWIESGGPQVTDETRTRASQRRGFGRFLLERGIAHSLDGKVISDLRETGLQVLICFPAAAQAHPAEDLKLVRLPAPDGVPTPMLVG